MPKFIIERTVPGAGDLGPEQLCEIARTSNAVVDGLDTPYTWHQSYAAGDKIYCVHTAESAEVVREHGRRGGFPVDSVTEIGAEFGPATAGA